jgi:hypothetical protein
MLKFYSQFQNFKLTAHCPTRSDTPYYKYAWVEVSHFWQDLALAMALTFGSILLIYTSNYAYCKISNVSLSIVSHVFRPCSSSMLLIKLLSHIYVTIMSSSCQTNLKTRVEDSIQNSYSSSVLIQMQFCK